MPSNYNLFSSILINQTNVQGYNSVISIAGKEKYSNYFERYLSNSFSTPFRINFFNFSNNNFF